MVLPELWQRLDDLKRAQKVYAEDYALDHGDSVLLVEEAELDSLGPSKKKSRNKLVNRQDFSIVATATVRVDEDPTTTTLRSEQDREQASFQRVVEWAEKYPKFLAAESNRFKERANQRALHYIDQASQDNAHKQKILEELKLLCTESINREKAV